MHIHKAIMCMRMAIVHISAAVKWHTLAQLAGKINRIYMDNVCTSYRS